MHQNSQQRTKNILDQNNFFSPEINFIWTGCFEKKSMQLLWTVITNSLENAKHETEHDADIAYGVCIH